MVDFFRYNTKNAKALLKNLYFNPSMTRGRLSRVQNCTPAMISIISGKMLADNIIKEAPHIETVVKTGPKEKALVFNGDFALMLGIYVGKKRVSVGVANARNKPITHVSAMFDETDKKGKLEFVEKSGNELIRKFGKSKFFAVGIGAIGVKDSHNPVSDCFGEAINLKEHFEKLFALPVAADNNVRALASAEYVLGDKRQDDRFILVKYGPGLGSAMAPTPINASDDVFLGEIGHMPTESGNRKCSCGKTGCLEAEVCEERILEAYNALSGNALCDVTYVYELTDKGDKAAKEAVKLLVDKLALTISQLFLIFKNVKVVLIGKAFTFPKIKESLVKKTEEFLCSEDVPSRLLFSTQSHEERFLGGSAVAIWNLLLN